MNSRLRGRQRVALPAPSQPAAASDQSARRSRWAQALAQLGPERRKRLQNALRAGQLTGGTPFDGAALHPLLAPLSREERAQYQDLPRHRAHFLAQQLGFTDSQVASFRCSWDILWRRGDRQLALTELARALDRAKESAR